MACLPNHTLPHQAGSQRWRRAIPSSSRTSRPANRRHRCGIRGTVPPVFWGSGSRKAVAPPAVHCLLAIQPRGSLSCVADDGCGGQALLCRPDQQAGRGHLPGEGRQQVKRCSAVLCLEASQHSPVCTAAPSLQVWLPPVPPCSVTPHLPFHCPLARCLSCPAPPRSMRRSGGSCGGRARAPTLASADGAMVEGRVQGRSRMYMHACTLNGGDAYDCRPRLAGTPCCLTDYVITTREFGHLLRCGGG